MTRTEYEYSQLPMYEIKDYTAVKFMKKRDWDKCYYFDNKQVPKSLVHSIKELDHGYEVLIQTWYVEKKGLNSNSWEYVMKRNKWL